MGEHGPAAKPLALRLLHGDPKKSRTDLVEPNARGLTNADPPAWMDSADRALWEEVIAELDAMGIIRQIDLYIVATFVRAYRTFEKATLLIARTDVLIKGAKGNLVRNPAVAVQRDAMNMVRLMGRELGMSPAARTMMAVRPTGDDAQTVAARYLSGA